jgi:hypothetical protein
LTLSYFFWLHIIGDLIHHHFDTIHSTLPPRVSAHAPQFSWSPSPYSLSDLIDNDKFINSICTNRRLNGHLGHLLFIKEIVYVHNLLKVVWWEEQVAKKPTEAGTAIKIEWCVTLQHVLLLRLLLAYSRSTLPPSSFQ